jgi:hypothetical protein
LNDWDESRERVKKSFSEVDTRYKLIPKNLILDAAQGKKKHTDLMDYFNLHLKI